MAHATQVKSAQKDIYENGKYVKYTSKKGKREGQELTKLDRTIPKDESDKIFIAKGESYWWWAFKNGGKHFSKERPKASQLTQSNYLGQLYTIQEEMDEFNPETAEDIEAFVSNTRDNIENLKEETEGSLENMPESLQSSPTGELLQERIDALDSAVSEFENIDCEYEEPDTDQLKEMIAEEEDIDTNEDDWQDKITVEQVEEKAQEKLQEWLDEKIEEIQSISLE